MSEWTFKDEINDLKDQIRLLRKKSDDEIWYYRWDRFFEDTHIENLKYDPRLNQWFYYDGGVFKQMEEDEIRTLIYEFGVLTNDALNNGRVSFLLKRIRAQCLFKGEWNPDPHIDNCLNGLINKETRELLPHTNTYPSNLQIERNYTLSDGIIPPLFFDAMQIIPDDQERNWFIQFFINVIHNFFDDEIFCILYGPKSGGKSTILQLFELLLGKKNISKTPLQKFGKRFGLTEMFNKRVNVNPDLPITPMSDTTISVLKQLTGSDGMIEVELKGINLFTHKVCCFLVFGINQLMDFSKTAIKEADSIFRRALLVELPSTLKRNSLFKKSLQDPMFLDALYSWLVWMRPRPLIEDECIEDWITLQKRKWLTNANPILTICHELFEYCEDSVISVQTVIEKVRENLEDDGIMTSHQLQQLVTQALQTMKIYRNNKRGRNAQYENIIEHLF